MAGRTEAEGLSQEETIPSTPRIQGGCCSEVLLRAMCQTFVEQNGSGTNKGSLVRRYLLGALCMLWLQSRSLAASLPCAAHQGSYVRGGHPLDQLCRPGKALAPAGTACCCVLDSLLCCAPGSQRCLCPVAALPHIGPSWIPHVLVTATLHGVLLLAPAPTSPCNSCVQQALRSTQIVVSCTACES